MNKKIISMVVLTLGVLNSATSYGMYDPENKMNQVSEHNGMKIQTLSAPVPTLYEAKDVYSDKGEVVGKTRAIPIKTGYISQDVHDKEGNVIGQTRSMPVPELISEIESKVSDNDMNLYKHIKKTLDKKYLKLEQKFIKNIEAKTSKMSETVRRNYLESYADKIDELTSKFLMQYPQDIALPEKANNIYLTLELLEQEIRIRLIAGIED